MEVCSRVCWWPAYKSSVSRAMITSTNITTVKRMVELMNSTCLDLVLLQSEGDWTGPNLRHEVDEENGSCCLYTSPISSKLWKTKLEFLISWYHKFEVWKCCRYFFFHISFALSRGRKSEYAEWCWWVFFWWFELLCKPWSLNAGLAWVGSTPTQSSSQTLATFVCLVFPLFSCFSRSSPHGFTHPTL